MRTYQSPNHGNLAGALWLVALLVMSPALTGSASAQEQVIAIHRDYIIFDRDTFNRADAGGVVHGPGIDYDQNYGVPLAAPPEGARAVIQRLCTRVTGFGAYKDGRKDGRWFYSSTGSLDTMDAAIVYDRGAIAGPLTIYDKAAAIRLMLVRRGDHWVLLRPGRHYRQMEQVSELPNIDSYLRKYRIVPGTVTAPEQKDRN